MFIVLLTIGIDVLFTQRRFVRTSAMTVTSHEVGSRLILLMSYGLDRRPPYDENR